MGEWVVALQVKAAVILEAVGGEEGAEVEAGAGAVAARMPH